MNIGVVGGGTMGNGIAHVFAIHNYNVTLIDLNSDILKKSSSTIVKSSIKWKPLLKKTSLSANKTHVFRNKLMKNNKINFIKINIYPDGGISRFKIFGKSI